MPGRKETRPVGRIETVGIVVKPDDADVVAAAATLASSLAARGVSVLGDDDWAHATDAAEAVSRVDLMERSDLVVVLGGDGSLLGVARLTGPRPVPVLGIHHGDFGFLTDAGDQDLDTVIDAALAGNLSVENRGMLAVVVKRAGDVVAEAQGLNDAVIGRGSLSRMLTLEVSVDGEMLAEYRGDGLIVATPTGSTAYSLSAGGPVVEPSMHAMVLTPIAPHTLGSRPLVLPDSSTIAVRVASECDDAALTVDGQEQVELEPGDVCQVTRSPNRAAIATVSRDGYFSILRRKLHWAARGEGRSRRPR